MTVFHLTQSEASFYVPAPFDNPPPPVPDHLNWLPYGYRWNPLRREIYSHIQKYFPDAYINEQVKSRGYRLPDSVFLIAEIIVTQKVMEWTTTGFMSRAEPRLVEIESGATFDLHLWDQYRWAPPLHRIRFTELTQSFPSDIVLPQSRRYR